MRLLSINYTFKRRLRRATSATTVPRTHTWLLRTSSATLRCPKAVPRASSSSCITAGKSSSLPVPAVWNRTIRASRYERPQKRRHGTPAETQNPATAQRTHRPGSVTNVRVTLRYSVATVSSGTYPSEQPATVHRWILINDARFPFSLPPNNNNNNK